MRSNGCCLTVRESDRGCRIAPAHDSNVGVFHSGSFLLVISFQGRFGGRSPDPWYHRPRLCFLSSSALSAALLASSTDEYWPISSARPSTG